jgi:hypothetical protein
MAAQNRQEFEAVAVVPPGRATGRPHTVRRAVVMAVLLGLPIAAQVPGTPLHLQVPDRPNFTYDPGAVPDAAMDAKRLQLLNAERQKSMVTDAEKLLRLARELNDDPASGGATISPAEKMHKVSEIEKLAKGIKDKMSYSIGDGPKIATPPSMWQR